MSERTWGFNSPLGHSPSPERVVSRNDGHDGGPGGGNDAVWCPRGTVDRRQVSVVGTGWPHGALALAEVPPRDVSALPGEPSDPADAPG